MPASEFRYLGVVYLYECYFSVWFPETIGQIFNNPFLWSIPNIPRDDVIKWKHFPRYSPLCGEFTGNWWIPLTKASDAELWCFLCFASEQRLRKRAHWDVTVMSNWIMQLVESFRIMTTSILPHTPSANSSEPNFNDIVPCICILIIKENQTYTPHVKPNWGSF